MREHGRERERANFKGNSRPRETSSGYLHPPHHKREGSTFSNFFEACVVPEY